MFVTLVISGTTTLDNERFTDSLMTESKYLIFSLAIVVLLFVSCDNELVSRAEYNAALSRADSLEAQNDELQFELSDLKHYNDYLEKKLDSLQNGNYPR